MHHASFTVNLKEFSTSRQKLSDMLRTHAILIWNGPEIVITYNILISNDLIDSYNTIQFRIEYEVGGSAGRALRLKSF